MCCFKRMLRCFFGSFWPRLARSRSTAATAASARFRAMVAALSCDSLGIFVRTIEAAERNGASTPPTGTRFAISTAAAFAFWTLPDAATFFAPAFRLDVAADSATFATAADFCSELARGFVTTSIAWLVAELVDLAVTFVRFAEVWRAGARELFGFFGQ